MKKLFITSLLLGAVGFSGSHAIAQIPARPAEQTPVTDKVPELSEEALNAWIKKLNIYTSLFNRSSRGIDSWKRYTSWVDTKTGPTGKERNVYGLYSLYDDAATNLAPKAIAAASAEPRMGSLDATASAFAASLQTLHPVVSEAYSYYSRKDYSDDKFAKAKELHPKLMAAFGDYIAKRNIFEEQLTSIKKQTNIQSLAQIEKLEGRKYRWHSKRSLMEAEKTLEVLTATQSKKDLPAFADAVKSFSEVTRDFDDYVAQSDDGKGKQLTGQLSSLLAKFRDAREALEKGNERSFVSNANSAISSYNTMIRFSRL